ncbi:uracil-DNA glycosylase [Natronobiforma cellulositropha]|uniref:uracil-DNA glycosylase n=1 Tax=Natronobiforma cellulositropha TaxID=1679076 RepID=UPI0021D58F70|nr:uracil-DNA glycosylase [Natronobiforma cellulositropha]
MSRPDADPAFPSSRHVLEADCERCPALADARECISWGTGSLEASVFVVGEAPGAGNPDAERWRGGNWTGMAYTARHSGRRIRRTLAAVGFADDAYYTNAVKCFPADPQDPTTNREPTAAERTACRPHLERELECVSPTVILATGRHATQTVLEADGDSLDGFLETVLEPRRSERFDCWLLPMLHPAYRDVWVGRLGHDVESYLAALGETLAELCADSR